jgi:hypothetical protein
VVASLTLALASTALAAPAEQGGPVYLPTEADVTLRVPGNGPDNVAAGAGDVNGDGYSDVIVSGPFGHDNEYTYGAHVIFSRPNQRFIDLGSLGSIGPQGFLIRGEGGEINGPAVAGAGDVNGDGLADVMVGVTGASNNERPLSGSVYIVYGKRDHTTVDLHALGARGTRIDGATGFEEFVTRGDQLGGSLAPAGDLNGDGFSDVIVGARSSASAWVVFGSPSNLPVDLAALGSRGFRIDPAIQGFDGPAPVAGVGDVNGDGHSDVMVSSVPYSHVVFGTPSTTTVDLSAPGDRAWRISDRSEDSFFGVPGAGAGDVNLDGLADLIIGLPGRDAGGINNAGAVRILFGRADRTTVDVSDPGGGYFINGFADNGFAGSSVAGPGDVNGDGRPDVMLVAPQNAVPNCLGCGAGFVAFGSGSTANVALPALGSAGFRMDGARDSLTRSVARIGDYDGDGAADALISSAGQPAIGGSDSFVYVVLGFGVDTPRERMLRLAESVRELAVAGKLRWDLEQRVVRRLLRAVAALDAGNERQAIRRLNRFAARVATLGARHRMVAADAQLAAHAALRIAKELAG